MSEALGGHFHTQSAISDLQQGSLAFDNYAIGFGANLECPKIKLPFGLIALCALSDSSKALSLY